NEDRAPDAYYLGKGDGAFRQITRSDRVVPHSTGTTMSIASGDTNNDLLPEIYVGQITGLHGKANGTFRDASSDVCDEISHPGHRNSCREIMGVHQRMPRQTRTLDPFKCLAKDLQDYREDCSAYSLLLWARQHGPRERCDLFPGQWAAFRFICDRAFD